tara:strand:+ start:213 stop:1751 length:1539 start_codon:yes stop_codon:yes gene_type:complete
MFLFRGCITILLTFGLIANAQETNLQEQLSLNGSLVQALKLNPDMATERINVEVSKDQLTREKGEFSWGLETISRYEDRDKPQNTREFIAVGGISFPGNSARIFSDQNFTTKEGLKKRFKTGTTFELSSTFSRLENTLNQTSESSLYSPEYESFTGITMTQPLLKGFGKSANMVRINIAKNRIEATKYLAEIRAINLIAETASRYTDVISIEEILSIRKNNILLAESLLSKTQELFKAERGVKIDVTTAELALFQRQDDYIGSNSLKVERLNNLFELIDMPPASNSQIKFKPLGAFFDGDNLPNKDDLINIALKNRVDLKYYDELIESSNLNLVKAKDETKALLNFSGSYGAYGLSDKGVDSYSESFNRQGMEWSVGLNFKMILDKKARNAGYRVAINEMAKAKIEKDKVKKAIVLEIDTAYERLVSYKKALRTARKAVELAEERLNQEQELWQKGVGDVYRLVEQQQMLGNAKIRTVEAEGALSKSVISLWISSGQVFQKLGIDRNLIGNE